MVLSVNLTENLNRIDKGIQQFNEEIVDLQGKIHDKQNEIRRLEGCRIAYQGIRDAVGDICYSGEDEHHDDHDHHDHDHDHHHQHNTNSSVPETSQTEVTFRSCSTPDEDLSSGCSNEDLSLEELYKKYRVM